MASFVNVKFGSRSISHSAITAGLIRSLVLRFCARGYLAVEVFSSLVHMGVGRSQLKTFRIHFPSLCATAITEVCVSITANCRYVAQILRRIRPGHFIEEPLVGVYFFFNKGLTLVKLSVILRISVKLRMSVSNYPCNHGYPM